jgi:hypothetical protein
MSARENETATKVGRTINAIGKAGSLMLADLLGDMFRPEHHTGRHASTSS